MSSFGRSLVWFGLTLVSRSLSLLVSCPKISVLRPIRLYWLVFIGWSSPCWSVGSSCGRFIGQWCLGCLISRSVASLFGPSAYQFIGPSVGVLAPCLAGLCPLVGPSVNLSLCCSFSQLVGVLISYTVGLLILDLSVGCSVFWLAGPSVVHSIDC